jgi:hypothetical protein
LRLGVVLYAAKCYWPGVSQTELEHLVGRGSRVDCAANPAEVTYVGSLLFADDELVLCLFEGPSRTAVKRTSERLGIPCERVMGSVWLDPDPISKGVMK